MAKIKPFQGLIYNTDKVDLNKVVAPPYDVVDTEFRDILYDSSPYNAIRLILNRSEQPYQQAHEFLENWIEEDVLIFDKAPSIYLCCQDFDYRKKQYKRYGFISVMKIENPGSDILPHERTHEGPKKDRFNLISKVNANLSPIFAVFQDNENKILDILKSSESKKPDFQFVFQGVAHSLWKISDPILVKSIATTMADKYILIADGHHRYEVALKYRDAMRKYYGNNSGEEPYDYVMSYFVPVNQEGLLVLPTHRVITVADGPGIIEKLRPFLKVTEYGNKKKLFKDLVSQKKPSFGLFLNSKFYLLRDVDTVCKNINVDDESMLKLDVVILHKVIFENILHYQGDIEYIKDEDDAVSISEKSGNKAAFFLNPVSVEAIIAIAGKKLLMPQKSTYFYPKIPTGLVFYKF